MKRRKNFSSAKRFRYVNIPVFRGSYHQKGYGLGSTIFKNVLPFLKRGLASVGKKALNVGVNALSDIAENNTSVKDAFKNQLHQEYRTLTNRINRPLTTKAVSVRKAPAKKGRITRKRAKDKSGFKKITL